MASPTFMVLYLIVHFLAAEGAKVIYQDAVETNVADEPLLRKNAASSELIPTLRSPVDNSLKGSETPHLGFSTASIPSSPDTPP